MARKLYWHARYCLHTRGLAKAAQSLWAGLNLLRMGGIAGALQYKIGGKTEGRVDLASNPAASESPRREFPS